MIEEFANASKTGISVLSDAEKLGITGMVLLMFVIATTFAVVMYREERKCRTSMFEEVKKCRDEMTALLKSDLNHARISKSGG